MCLNLHCANFSFIFLLFFFSVGPGLSTGTIIGIVVGTVVFIILVIVLVILLYCCCCKPRADKQDIGSATEGVPLKDTKQPDPENGTKVLPQNGEDDASKGSPKDGQPLLMLTDNGEPAKEAEKTDEPKGDNTENTVAVPTNDESLPKDFLMSVRTQKFMDVMQNPNVKGRGRYCKRNPDGSECIMEFDHTGATPTSAPAIEEGCEPIIEEPASGHSSLNH